MLGVAGACGLPPNRFMGLPPNVSAEVMRRPMDSNSGTGRDSTLAGGRAGGAGEKGALVARARARARARNGDSGAAAGGASALCIINLTSSKKSRSSLLNTTFVEQCESRPKYLRAAGEWEGGRGGVSARRCGGERAPQQPQQNSYATHSSNALRRSFIRLADELPKRRVGGSRGSTHPGKSTSSRSCSAAISE